MHGMRRRHRAVRTGDAVRWTPINEVLDTPARNKMVHRVNGVSLHASAPYYAWIACHPLYRACAEGQNAQFAVTDEPVDCMACIAADCATLEG